MISRRATLAAITALTALAAATIPDPAHARSPSGVLSFQREKIYIAIEKDRIEVRGHYFFHNETGRAIRTRLVYPFPVDSTMLFPDRISVFICAGDGTREEIPSTRAGDIITFMIESLPDKVLEVLVVYSQRVLHHEARYILTTTKTWGKPLESAEFFVEVPRDLEILSFSYGAFEPWESNGKTIYHMLQENFLPERDLVFSWAEKGQK